MLKPRREPSGGRRVFVEGRRTAPRTDCMGLFLSRGFSAGHLLFLSSLSQFLFFSSSARVRNADSLWPTFHRRKRFTLEESIVKTLVCRRCCPPIEYATTGVTMGRYQRPCLGLSIIVGEGMRAVRGPPGHRAAMRAALSPWRPPPESEPHHSARRDSLDALQSCVNSAQSSSTRRLIIGVTALALATVLSTSVASSDVVRLRNVDGGPEYYSRFSNSLPSDPNYFPLGVWFESVLSQADVDLDKDAGLNLYVVLTTTSNLSLVQSNGMRAILQQSEWRTNQAAINNPAVAGWQLHDEIDMQQANAAGAVAARNQLNNILASLPADGRLRYNNYGKGIMFWNSDSDAQQYVNNFQDVTSVDEYWFTDPDVSIASQGGHLLNNNVALTPTQTRRAANYGYTVDRIRTLDAMDGGRRPIWNFVEVGWPVTKTASQGGRTILPAEVRAAVWHSIIAGARGIIYFNHSFGGPNQSQHCLREPPYAAVRVAVKSTNQLVTQLAPVLNAPSADGFVSAGPSVRTMAKFHHNKYYVFAGSKENVASTPTILLSGVDRGVATVVGENRTIPISYGRFSDSFADGNAIHIYRIDNQ
jgi:hypothetical protein